MSHKRGINVKQQSFGKPNLAHETLILALHFGALIGQRRRGLRGQSGSGFRRCPCWGAITGGRLAIACRGSGQVSDTLSSCKGRAAKPSLSRGFMRRSSPPGKRRQRRAGIPWLLLKVCRSQLQLAYLTVVHMLGRGRLTWWGSIPREAGWWSIAWEAGWWAVARHAVARRGTVACTCTTPGQPLRRQAAAAGQQLSPSASRQQRLASSSAGSTSEA